MVVNLLNFLYINKMTTILTLPNSVYDDSKENLYDKFVESGSMKPIPLIFVPQSLKNQDIILNNDVTTSIIDNSVTLSGDSYTFSEPGNVTLKLSMRINLSTIGVKHNKLKMILNKLSFNEENHKLSEDDITLFISQIKEPYLTLVATYLENGNTKVIDPINFYLMEKNDPSTLQTPLARDLLREELFRKLANNCVIDNINVFNRYQSLRYEYIPPFELKYFSSFLTLRYLLDRISDDNILFYFRNLHDSHYHTYTIQSFIINVLWPLLNSYSLNFTRNTCVEEKIKWMDFLLQIWFTKEGENSRYHKNRTKILYHIKGAVYEEKDLSEEEQKSQASNKISVPMFQWYLASGTLLTTLNDKNIHILSKPYFYFKPLDLDKSQYFFIQNSKSFRQYYDDVHKYIRHPLYLLDVAFALDDECKHIESNFNQTKTSLQQQQKQIIREIENKNEDYKKNLINKITEEATTLILQRNAEMEARKQTEQEKAIALAIKTYTKNPTELEMKVNFIKQSIANSIDDGMRNISLEVYGKLKESISQIEQDEIFTEKGKEKAKELANMEYNSKIAKLDKDKITNILKMILYKSDLYLIGNNAISFNGDFTSSLPLFKMNFADELFGQFLKPFNDIEIFVNPIYYRLRSLIKKQYENKTFSVLNKSVSISQMIYIICYLHNAFQIVLDPIDLKDYISRIDYILLSLNSDIQSIDAFLYALYDYTSMNEWTYFLSSDSYFFKILSLTKDLTNNYYLIIGLTDTSENTLSNVLQILTNQPFSDNNINHRINEINTKLNNNTYDLTKIETIKKMWNQMPVVSDALKYGIYKRIKDGFLQLEDGQRFEFIILVPMIYLFIIHIQLLYQIKLFSRNIVNLIDIILKHLTTINDIKTLYQNVLNIFNNVKNWSFIPEYSTFIFPERWDFIHEVLKYQNQTTPYEEYYKTLKELKWNTLEFKDNSLTYSLLDEKEDANYISFQANSKIYPIDAYNIYSLLDDLSKRWETPLTFEDKIVLIYNDLPEEVKMSMSYSFDFIYIIGFILRYRGNSNTHMKNLLYNMIYDKDIIDKPDIEYILGNLNRLLKSLSDNTFFKNKPFGNNPAIKIFREETDDTRIYFKDLLNGFLDQIDYDVIKDVIGKKRRYEDFNSKENLAAEETPVKYPNELIEFKVFGDILTKFYNQVSDTFSYFPIHINSSEQRVVNTYYKFLNYEIYKILIWNIGLVKTFSYSSIEVKTTEGEFGPINEELFGRINGEEKLLDNLLYMLIQIYEKSNVNPFRLLQQNANTISPEAFGLSTYNGILFPRLIDNKRNQFRLHLYISKIKKSSNPEKKEIVYGVEFTGSVGQGNFFMLSSESEELLQITTSSNAIDMEKDDKLHLYLEAEFQDIRLTCKDCTCEFIFFKTKPSGILRFFR